MLCCKNYYSTLTLLEKINSKTLKMASKYPQISWLFYFYMTYLKSKKWLVFHNDFGCSEGGGGKPPRHLMYIFDPIPNRAGTITLLCSISCQFFLRVHLFRSIKTCLCMCICMCAKRSYNIKESRCGVHFCFIL